MFVAPNEKGVLVVAVEVLPKSDLDWLLLGIGLVMAKEARCKRAYLVVLPKRDILNVNDQDYTMCESRLYDVVCTIR